jgi:hypothetical protein
MACGSYCWVCGKIYDSNVKTCGICGNDFYFNGSHLICKKDKYKQKISIKEYNNKLMEEYFDEGIIRNIFMNKPKLVVDSVKEV